MSCMDALVSFPSAPRVMIVSDILPRLEEGALLVQASGYAAVVARSVAAALRFSSIVPRPVLVLADMAGTASSIHVLEALRALAWMRETPLIAVAGRSPDDGFGSVQWTERPTTIQAFELLLQRWVRLPGGRSASMLRTWAEDGPVAGLGEIHGLAVGQGMAMMRNDPDKYVRLLKIFVETCECQIENLFAWSSANDAKKLEAAAHSLRGSAGVAGARTISGLADALLRHVRSDSGGGTEEASRLGFQLADELAYLVADIRRVVSEAHGGEPNGEQCDARVLELLALLLAQGDMRALSLAREERGALERRLGDAATALMKCIEDFDFEGAASVLSVPMGRRGAG